VAASAGGALQFSAWKAHHLACCREAPARGHTLPADGSTAWRHGLRLGLQCSHCCAGLIAILLPTRSSIVDRGHRTSVGLRAVSHAAHQRRCSRTIVSPRSSIATRAAIFFARPAGVFMLFVRNASAKRFMRPSVRNVFRARGFGATAKDGENRRIPFNRKERLAAILKRRSELGPESHVFGSTNGGHQPNTQTAWETLRLLAHGIEPRKGCGMEPGTGAANRPALARPASRRRVPAARRRRGHPNHPADARPRQHSANAAILQREGRGEGWR
jgi:hypothetical protein